MKRSYIESDLDKREKAQYFSAIQQQISKICNESYENQDISMAKSESIFQHIDFSKLTAEQLNKIAEIT